MQIIGENSALTISLVSALVGVSFASAMYLNRFVTKAELRQVITDVSDHLQRLDDKLDKVFFAHKR